MMRKIENRRQLSSVLRGRTVVSFREKYDEVAVRGYDKRWYVAGDSSGYSTEDLEYFLSYPMYELTAPGEAC